ncbi:hypothetical protein PG987_015882 [Apiospora arundinis]
MTWENGGLAHPTTITLTDATTFTLPGGWLSWGGIGTTVGLPPNGLLKGPNGGFLQVKGTLPPFPKITIGWDNKLTYASDKYSQSCTTQTAEVCAITTSVVVQSSTITSRSTITASCETVRGCELIEEEPEETATTTTISSTTSSSSSACTPTARGSIYVCFNDAVVLPVDPHSVGEIPDILNEFNYTGKYQAVEAGGLTGFYWVPALAYQAYLRLLESPDVDVVDYYEQRMKAFPETDFDWGDRANFSHVLHPDGDPNRPKDVTGPKFAKIFPRANATFEWSNFWERAPPSLPSTDPMCQFFSCRVTQGGWVQYNYYWDGTGGYDNETDQGWTVFVTSENGTYLNHDILNEVTKNNGALKNKAVINNSWGFPWHLSTEENVAAHRHVFQELDDAGVVIIFAAGNDASPEAGKRIRHWPQLLASPFLEENPLGQLENLIIVGATDEWGTTVPWGEEAPWMTTFAPGENVGLPFDPALGPGFETFYHPGRGTSYAAPAASGVIAYLRSLPGPFHEPLQKPRNAKKMISWLHHRYDIMNAITRELLPIYMNEQRPVVWNGEVQFMNQTIGRVVTMSCLKDWDTRDQWDTRDACHGLDPDMDLMPDTGESVEAEEENPGSDICSGDDDTPPLSLPPRELGRARSIIAQPTCSAAGGCGGTLCSGFYCAASPTGTPPDHQDPQDPNNGQPVSSSTVSLSWSTEAPAPTALSSWISQLTPPASSSSSSAADTGGSGSNPSGTTGGGGSNPSGTTDAPQPTQTCDDQCRLDRGNPCCPDGEPCQAEEPSCCKTEDCPICLCSDTSCTATSPKCCLTNSCAWSWTGGNGENKAVAVLHQLDNQLASIANSSAAVYGLWSHHGNGSDGDSWHISGYDGKMTADNVCKETPAWSAFATLNNDTNLDTGLQTWYSNLTVFGDSCSYLAGVSDYAGVAAGVKVGALTCGKWSTANCFRANHTDVHDCGTGKVAQELVCQW